jgi:arylsulfatase A-like enzyme
LYIFASDNGPEFRWPGHVEANRVSDDIVHATDLFTTLIRIGGGTLPIDRPIDGLDQTPWLSASTTEAVTRPSAREGFLL